jgi:hypothetical protein
MKMKPPPKLLILLIGINGNACFAETPDASISAVRSVARNLRI